MAEKYLIVGLGNPGKTYEKTRHNIGFRIVKAIGMKYAITFRPSLIRAKGNLGKGMIQDKSVHLLMPLTYMNESGLSVRKSLNFFDIPIEHLIVIADDVAIPFGKLRLRKSGSCGGHNGLRNIETHLGTDQYTRLRIGVGSRQDGDLSDHVLGNFSVEEEVDLPQVVDRAIQGIEFWLASGIDAAMQEVNM